MTTRTIIDVLYLIWDVASLHAHYMEEEKNVLDPEDRSGTDEELDVIIKKYDLISKSCLDIINAIKQQNLSLISSDTKKTFQTAMQDEDFRQWTIDHLGNQNYESSSPQDIALVLHNFSIDFLKFLSFWLHANKEFGTGEQHEIGEI